jgi:hypothetical protein
MVSAHPGIHLLTHLTQRPRFEHTGKSISVRDIWQRKNLGPLKDPSTVNIEAGLGAFDSKFLLLAA